MCVGNLALHSRVHEKFDVFNRVSRAPMPIMRNRIPVPCFVCKSQGGY